MDVRIAGRPDETELAAVLAVLGRAEPARNSAARTDPLRQWRAARRAALRRTQQTR